MKITEAHLLLDTMIATFKEPPAKSISSLEQGLDKFLARSCLNSWTEESAKD